jgi:hypothetical protein
LYHNKGGATVPGWIQLAITIINATTQLIRLIIELRKDDEGKKEAKDLPGALKQTRLELKASREGITP